VLKNGLYRDSRAQFRTHRPIRRARFPKWLQGVHGVDATLLPSLALTQGSLNASQACRNVPYSPASAEPVIHLFCLTATHAGLPPAPHARARAENLTNSHLVSEKGNPPIATVGFSKFVFPRAMAFF
jgi:hypothetical protein